MNRSAGSKTLTPSNLEKLFFAEISLSPRYSDAAASAVFSPTHKSAHLNQFQQQQSILSPIKTNFFLPKKCRAPFIAGFIWCAIPRKDVAKKCGAYLPNGLLSLCICSANTLEKIPTPKEKKAIHLPVMMKGLMTFNKREGAKLF
jgi:hypothetical protein